MVRFLADASLHDAIVTGCLRREPAIDFLSAHEARLEGVPDPDVLAFATRDEENRQLRENFGAESASLRKQIKRLTPKRTQVEEHHHATAKAALEQFAEFRADIEVALHHLLERETLYIRRANGSLIPEGMLALTKNDPVALA